MFRFFGRRRSKDNVKERLKLVLSYDRAKLTPGKMEELKTELLGVIGKYFPSSEQEYDVRFEQHGERMVLMANLPMAGSLPDGEAAEDGAAARKPAQAASAAPATKSGGGKSSSSGKKKSKRKN